VSSSATGQTWKCSSELPLASAPPHEYARLLSRAGFRMTRVVETASPFSVVEATAIVLN
jgi:hypothetical protein